MAALASQVAPHRPKENNAQDPSRPRGRRRDRHPARSRHDGRGSDQHGHRRRLHPGYRGLRGQTETHVEYKYSPAKSSEGPTQWALQDAAANTPATYVVKGKNVAYFRDGVKTQTIIDTPAVEAVDGVNCGVMLPQFDTTNVAYTPLANVTVPFTPHVNTYLYGVQGYDQNVPITEDVNVDRTEAWQFWVNYVPEDGYVALNAGQWHIDFWTFTSDFTVPTVSGYGINGVVNFGDHHNGTWKVGSKVPLDLGRRVPDPRRHRACPAR